MVVAQSVADYAGKQKGLGSRPSCRQKFKGVLVAGEVSAHIQSTAEVPVSKVPKAQMLS